ncbi:hypothetical protein OG767_21250 [Micromonospora sp. NBC_01392]|uniref:hypothetical protein n=1 Tax=Micromonospora sp. NBC_01392 TaxID=2903588 RepID=UPI003246B527
MDRFWRGGLAAVSVVVAVSGVTVVLLGEGLDRAEKWVSIAGVVLSVIFGAAGAVLGFLHWRHSEATRRPPATGAGAGSSAATSTAEPVPGPDLRHARGVQVGNGNTQENTFH